MLLSELLLEHLQQLCALVKVHARRLELRRELIALASEILRGGFDVSLSTTPRLRRVVHRHDHLAVIDALRHQALDLAVQTSVLLRQKLILLLIPRHLLVTLLRALLRGGFLSLPRGLLLALRRELLGELLHVILHLTGRARRLVHLTFLLPHLLLRAVELTLEHIQFLTHERDSTFGFLCARASLVCLLLEADVGATALLLHRLDLLVHHVELLVLLLNRGLEVLRGEEGVGAGVEDLKRMGERRAGGISVRVRTAGTNLGAHGLVLAGQLEDGGELGEAGGHLVGRDVRLGFDARLLDASRHLVQRLEVPGRDVRPVEEWLDVEVEDGVPRDAAVLGDERVGRGILRHRCHRREVWAATAGFGPRGAGLSGGRNPRTVLLLSESTRGGGLKNRNCTGGVSLSDDRGFRRKDADTRFATPRALEDASVRSPDDASARV